VSHLSPLRYAVDLFRVLYYAVSAYYGRGVLEPLGEDVAVIAAMVAVFTVAGTALFVRQERNR